MYNLRHGVSLKVFLCITVHDNLQWSVQLCEKDVKPSDCPLLAQLSSTIQTLAQLEELIVIIKESSPCTGNNDQCFLDMASSRKVFKDRKGMYILL